MYSNHAFHSFHHHGHGHGHGYGHGHGHGYGHGHGHDHHSSGTAEKLAAIPDDVYRKVLLDAKPPAGTNIRARPKLGRNNTLRDMPSPPGKKKEKKKKLTEGGKRSTTVILNKLLSSDGDGEHRLQQGFDSAFERGSEGGEGKREGETYPRGQGRGDEEQVARGHKGKGKSAEDKWSSQNPVSDDMVDSILWHDGHDSSSDSDFLENVDGDVDEDKDTHGDDQNEKEKRTKSRLDKGRRQRRRGRGRSTGNDYDGGADALWQRSRGDAKAASERMLREGLRKKNLFKAVGTDLGRGNTAMALLKHGGMKQKRRRQRKEAREAKRFNDREKKARAKLLERQRRAREKANAMAKLESMA